MDALGNILETAQLRGGLYFRCEFSSPWGMLVPRAPMGEFHVVVSGECWVRGSGRSDPVRLRAGDAVVFMHGDEHALLDRPDGTAIREADIVRGRLRSPYGPVVHGGGGAGTTILCGYFRFHRHSRNPLTRVLPPFLHVNGAELDDGLAMQPIVRLMVEESSLLRPGAQAVVNRLTEALFVRIVRGHLERSPVKPGLLAALMDPKVGEVLDLIHRDPARDWTLTALGRAVGLSRTGLASRFGALVGQPPARYITQWRIETGRRLLAETTLSQASIAERIGYGSEVAFAKRFKQIVGLSPGAYRRTLNGRNGSIEA